MILIFSSTPELLEDFHNSLPRISSKGNLYTNEEQKDKILIQKISSEHDRLRSPQVTNTKAKKAMVGIKSYAQISEEFGDTSEIHFRRRFEDNNNYRNNNQDGRLTKVIMRGTQSSNSTDPTKILTKRQIQEQDSDNIIYSKSRTKLNYHHGSISPPRKMTSTAAYNKSLPKVTALSKYLGNPHPASGN